MISQLNITSTANSIKVTSPDDENKIFPPFTKMKILIYSNIDIKKYNIQCTPIVYCKHVFIISLERVGS